MTTVRKLAAVIRASVLIACAFPVAAAAAGRTALVVSNAAYPDSDAPLPTPIGDGRALADELKRRGFSVFVAENAGKDALQEAVGRFLRGIEADGIALVYFGGYGIQAGRRNYLIPVDARIWSEADVARDGVSVDGLLDEMARRRAGIRVLVLDASRRNPFERRFRSFSQGLAPATGQPGSIALSAAAAGGVSNDGPGPRSPFMTELLGQIAGGHTVDQAFAATRDAQAKRARNGQGPALSINLEETFSFDPDRPRTAVARAPEGDDGAARAREAAERDARERSEKDRADSEARDRADRDRVDRERADRERAENDRVAREARERSDREAREGDSRERDRKAAQAAEQAASEERARASERRRAEQERVRLAELDERIRRNGRDEAAFYERGQFHAQRGDAPAAIADFDQAIRLNPSSPEAYNNRCWMRAMSDDLRRALTDCDQALKLRPAFLDALDSRGLVNLKAGSFRAAVSDYGDALKLDPRHSSALYGRGLARKRLGEDGQGGRDMASALELNPAIDKEFATYGLR